MVHALRSLRVSTRSSVVTMPPRNIAYVINDAVCTIPAEDHSRRMPVDSWIKGALKN